MKCEICKAKIKTVFLDKIAGSYIKDSKGKRHVICSDCQKKLKTKDKIVEELEK